MGRRRINDRAGCGHLLPVIDRGFAVLSMYPGSMAHSAELENLVPVAVGEGVHEHGKEDLFLLDNHLGHALDRRLQDELARGLKLLPGDARRFQDVEAAPQQVPDLVVLAPHDLGRAGDTTPFQVRKKQVLLALVVLVHVDELVEQRGQLEHSRLQLVVTNLAQGAKLCVGLLNHSDQRLVFLNEDVHGVALGNRPGRAEIHIALQDGRVDIAELEQLFGPPGIRADKRNRNAQTLGLLDLQRHFAVVVGQEDNVGIGFFDFGELR